MTGSLTSLTVTALCSAESKSVFYSPKDSLTPDGVADTNNDCRRQDQKQADTQVLIYPGAHTFPFFQVDSPEITEEDDKRHVQRPTREFISFREK